MDLAKILADILAEGYSPGLIYDAHHKHWDAFVRKPINRLQSSFGRAFSPDPVSALEDAFAARDNIDNIHDGSVAYVDKIKAADLRPKLVIRRL